MMEATRTSETLVNFYQTTRCYNPEDSNLHTHRRENLKSYLINNSYQSCYYHYCCCCWYFAPTNDLYANSVQSQNLSTINTVRRRNLNSVTDKVDQQETCLTMQKHTLSFQCICLRICMLQIEINSEFYFM
jgi:hypothetical protein